MKRASYRHAVELVAFNDEPGDSDALDIDTVAHLVSVNLMADLFGISVYRFAGDVVLRRLRDSPNDVSVYAARVRVRMKTCWRCVAFTRGTATANACPECHGTGVPR